MAIREFKFTVSDEGISPSSELRVGFQGEHNAARLVFELEEELYSKLTGELSSGEKLIYRFDCRDSLGLTVGSDPKELTSDTVSLELTESITRNGGKLIVYLVITKLSADCSAELELISSPARLRLENMPFRRADEDFESLSAAAEDAKTAAAQAAASADEAALAASNAAEAAKEVSKTAEEAIARMEAQIGLIDTQLDNIIAVQDGYIGGASV